MGTLLGKATDIALHLVLAFVGTYVMKGLGLGLGVLGVELGVAIRVRVRVRSYEPPLPGWC